VNIRHTDFLGTDGKHHTHSDSRVGDVTVFYASGHKDVFHGISRSEYILWWMSTWRGAVPKGITVRPERTAKQQIDEDLDYEYSEPVRGRYDMPTWESVRAKRLQRETDKKQVVTAPKKTLTGPISERLKRFSS
jgi:hypothetical protein